jgi:thiol-disulfide isomerase/thioredoxin
MSPANRRKALQAIALYSVSLGLTNSLPGCAARTPPVSAKSPLLGQPLPRLARTLEGTVLEGQQLLGRMVVVKFFAHYCKPCEKTLPQIQRLHELYPQVMFIGVSLDEHRDQLQVTIEQMGLTFPILFDPERLVAGRFRITELPVTFVVNRQGSIVWIAGPDQAEKDLQLALESLL